MQRKCAAHAPTLQFEIAKRKELNPVLLGDRQSKLLVWVQGFNIPGSLIYVICQLLG